MRKRRLFFFIFLLLSGFEVYAQREEDKVHLLSAELAEFYEYFGVKYRRVIGPARFLHNNTFILCDTALWNTTTNEIDAIGHVEVIQKGTRLTGETIHYIGDINVAEVRGRVVELIDKDQNRLRTQHLNFNTKDSIGYFFNGGSMVDNEGTILESRRGYYYSKEKLFSFYEHVEMGTDTVRIKADSLYYHSDINLAEFWGNVQGWHTDGFLTAEEGTYDRENEIFNFIRNVYIQTDEQEVWTDDVTYDRNKNTARLIKNIQIKDTTQQAIILGDRLDYRKEPVWAEVTENPVFAAYEIDKKSGSRDTLFVRADTLRFFSAKYGTIDSLELARALARQEIPDWSKSSEQTSATDTLTEATKDSVAIPPVPDSLTLARRERLENYLKDTRKASDSLYRADSLSVADHLNSVDSLFLAGATQLNDSLFINTEARFLYAYKNVRAFRQDMQAICDSMVYNSIDSMLRQYGRPVLWNEENQIVADSIQFRFSRDSLYRVDFMSGSFLISQEDSLFFHQIKGDEMTAHIKNNDIYRFDVLGNVKALFYIPEDSIITSLNIKEASEMNVLLNNRRAERITYKKSIKSDMIPLFDLKKDQERLSDFNWRSADRPKDRYAITNRILFTKPPRPFDTYREPVFPYTLKYFPKVVEIPPTLRSGVTTDAVKELLSRERENNINPFTPPETFQERHFVPSQQGREPNPIPKDVQRPTRTLRKKLY